MTIADLQSLERDLSARIAAASDDAALEAIRMALSEVGDGSTFVWHRWNGRVSGLVRPTASFKDVFGKVCRHIMIILNSGGQTGKIEGIACRLESGRWQLEG